MFKRTLKISFERGHRQLSIINVKHNENQSKRRKYHANNSKKANKFKQEDNNQKIEERDRSARQ